MTDANDYSHLKIIRHDDACDLCKQATEHPPFHDGCRCYWIRVRTTCQKCNVEMVKIGQTLGQRNFPIVECPVCKEFRWDNTMSGSIVGIVMQGKFYKVTSDGKVIPVAYPPSPLWQRSRSQQPVMMMRLLRFRRNGTPGRTRTCDPRIRNPFRRHER